MGFDLNHATRQFAEQVRTLRLVKGAIAALSQNKTHPADVACAISFLRSVVEG